MGGKAGKRDRKRWGWVNILRWCGQGGLTEKVMWEQRRKRGEEAGHPLMWGRSLHVMGTACAKAPRQVIASPAWLVAAAPLLVFLAIV